MSESVAACKNGVTAIANNGNKHNIHQIHRRQQHLVNSKNDKMQVVVKKKLAGGVQDNKATGWKVKASDGALNTSNPIREIIETMNLAENPAKKVIPLSIGDPTIFGNLKPCKEILESIQRANSSGKFYGYQTAAGMESAREAVAEYHHKCTGNRVKLQVSLCVCACVRAKLRKLINSFKH